ncbi:MAG: hypothetical protein BWK78_05965 [Thiotrichaceae bacterium IS1]|nr:MAG: hypothetical protein BWK78_05965 [Thiotrichaceae bacterium IS1]
MDFDDTVQQNNDALQSTIDSTTTSLIDGQNLGHDTYTQSAFDHNSLTETAYQPDNFSQENQWQDTAFQTAPEHSLGQDIDSLLNGSDSSDDSNNLNANNLTMPTFQHHVHYHPPHEHFNMPSYEGEHQRVASSESSTFHSSLDVNVSGSVDHYHRWVNPNNSYSGSGDSDSNSSYSNAPSSGTGSSCVDANGDGQCDSGGGSGDND